jgi:hypothetical protein
VPKRPKVAPKTLWWMPLPVLIPGDSLDETIQETDALAIKLRSMRADGLKIRPRDAADEVGQLRILISDNPAVAKKWKMDDAAGSIVMRPR